jgi:hypothetical protein
LEGAVKKLLFLCNYFPLEKVKKRLTAFGGKKMLFLT